MHAQVEAWGRAELLSWQSVNDHELVAILLSEIAELAQVGAPVAPSATTSDAPGKRKGGEIGGGEHTEAAVKILEARRGTVGPIRHCTTQRELTVSVGHKLRHIAEGARDLMEADCAALQRLLLPGAVLAKVVDVAAGEALKNSTGEPICKAVTGVTLVHQAVLFESEDVALHNKDVAGQESRLICASCRSTKHGGLKSPRGNQLKVKAVSLYVKHIGRFGGVRLRTMEAGSSSAPMQPMQHTHTHTHALTHTHTLKQRWL